MARNWTRFNPANLVNDDVIVNCYGNPEKQKRFKAIGMYLDCLDGSEGSEAERYARILSGLLRGANNVIDRLY